MANIRPDRFIHRRCVTLNRLDRSLEITDRLDSPRVGVNPANIRLAFHFHPFIEVTRSGNHLELVWGPLGSRRWARMELPPALSWSVHRGETDPPLGWYSPSFGQRQPAYCVIGTGMMDLHTEFRTRLTFMGVRQAAEGRAKTRVMA